jgi:hypothetical protein
MLLYALGRDVIPARRHLARAGGTDLAVAPAEGSVADCVRI